MTALARVPELGIRRVVGGVVLSMLVHAAIVLAYRPTAPQAYIAPAAPPIVVRLREREAEPVRKPEPVRASVVRGGARSIPARASRRVIAVVPGAVATAPEVVVEAQRETPAPANKFDLDAARSTARRVANTDPPNADDAPLFRLKKQQQMEMETETKGARLISAAKRADCKDGVPGGLLAPLIMLTQKKGTGCKW